MAQIPRTHYSEPFLKGKEKEKREDKRKFSGENIEKRKRGVQWSAVEEVGGGPMIPKVIGKGEEGMGPDCETNW